MPSRRILVTVDFGVPVAAAFGYLADPRNRPEWQASLRSVTVLDEGPPRRGMRWVDHTVPGLSFRLTIAAMEPDHLWSETGRWGPFRLTGTLSFEPAATGCRVTATASVTGRGPARLLGPPAAAAGLLAARRDLRRAARILEARAGG